MSLQVNNKIIPAFALFQEGNLDARKVEMLINCLETGKDIWSDLEKRLLQTKGS